MILPRGRHRKVLVPRFLLTVMLVAGLMLGGCAPEDAQTGEAGGKQKAEKAEPKPERPAEEEPRKQDRPDPGPQEKKSEPEKPEPEKPETKERDREPAPKPALEPESPSSSASASASAAASAAGDHDATATVSRVVDGDTIEISPAVDGNEEVRLIGMDTPETKDPSEEVEPLGPEASAFATDSLTGRSVGLEFDVEREDQYGRLLAYVYLSGEMFNETLVEEGLAQAYPYEPNTRYEERFAAAQEQARAAGIGIWGLSLNKQCLLADRGNGIGEGTPECSGASASASASPSASASASASASPSAAPSPSPSGSGGAPSGGGDIDCDQVDGPIPTPPGDPDGLDGDGDGLACE